MEPATAARPILAIDLGNTRIGVEVVYRNEARAGVAASGANEGERAGPGAGTARAAGTPDGAGSGDTLRFRHPTADAASLAAAWRERVKGDRPVPGVALLASVHPPAEAAVATWCREAFGLSPLRPRADFPLPLPLRVHRPDRVGIDRQLNAFAAFRRVGGACIAVSLGTAITVDAVSAAGEFLGGAIFAGAGLAAAALADRCALLPGVTLDEAPATALGRDTEEAIRAGIWFGVTGGVRRLVDRAREELGGRAAFLLTGGDAERFAPAFPDAAAVVDGLALEGLVLAYRESLRA